MKHLIKSIKLLSQSVEELQPQQGYPEFNPDWHQVVPEPIGYVYHVSPYAKEIMEQGFIVDPTKTTLGAFGDLNSVSTTNYENAETYKRGIQIVVGVANGEINTEELINTVGPKAKDAVVHVIEEEFLNFWSANFDIYKVFERLREQDPKAEFLDARKIIDKAKAEILPPTYNEDQKFREFTRSPDGKDWLWNICINDLDFEGNELSEEEAKKRRWTLLKAASLISDLPLVVGYDIPEHLKTREMHDVGIVEVAVAPTEYTQHDPQTIENQLTTIERHKQWMEESSDEYPEYTPEYINDWYQKQMDEIQDPKGKYTYSKGEQEWKFYDVTDLWPVRLVGMTRPKFKSYYHWEHQPVSEIVNRWANDNEQLYDPFMSGHEPKGVHGYYNIYNILPYREYIWTKEDARRSPEKWEELKESLRYGWNVDGPINIMIGKNRVAKVGEGNHRLAVAQELIEEEGLEALKNVPVFFGFWTTVNLNPGLRTPEERDVERQIDLEKQKKKEIEEVPVQYEEDEEKEELMKLLLSKNLKKAIKRLSLKINKDDLNILWYENDSGDKFVPNFEEDMPDDVPEGFDYMLSSFPLELTTSMLQLNPDGTSTEIMKGTSTYPEDLVLAMVDSGDYTLSESILIAANSCSRCLNVLCYEYGLDDGYPEFSEEWKKCGTECDFCKDMGHSRKGNNHLRKALTLLGQMHEQYLYHITPTESIPEIAQEGLKTEYGGTLTSYDKDNTLHQHARDKVFLTDPIAIDNWMRYVKNNDKEPAVLRINIDSVENIYVDEKGTEDSFRMVDWEPGQIDAPVVPEVFAFYVEEDIPSNKIEVLIDNEWFPIQRYTEE